ncbi:hypothetical protein HU200_044977 [Digitaria exilis]|uniref:Uncharacterized protein n=1 Tax=Digitaria exilis TaxID=1010633 RepID=A0A835B6Q3_9POAL|nr:hypothetical protein HU200_044977 [Digitaria exilis]
MSRQNRRETKRAETMADGAGRKKRTKRDMDGKEEARQSGGRPESKGGGGGPSGAEAGEQPRRRLAHAFRRAPCLRV